MTTPDVTALVDKVLIWSGEHRAWWRAAGAGYCESAVGAGVYSREEAEHLTAHCGPEKRIAIRSVRDVLAEASEGCVGAFLLSLVAQGEADRERLEAGARGVLATAAMMLAKLGGSARFTALEQVAIQGRVTRTDEPDGAFTLSFEVAARATPTEGPTHG